MVLDDDRGKHPRDNGSSHGLGLPPPCQMTMVAGNHWVPEAKGRDLVISSGS
jgi:hypothetical protein